MATFLAFVVAGIYAGAIYSLIALGVVSVYKSTRVLNFAQGHLVLLAALLSMDGIRRFGVVPGLLIALVVIVVVGLALERLTMRPLIGQPILAAILMTLAVTYILDAVIRLGWGVYMYSYPSLFPTAPIKLGQVTLTQEFIWASVVVLVVFGIFGFFYMRSMLGMAMRATAEDHQVAQSMGIRVTRVFSLSWAMAGALSLLGAVFLASISEVHVGMSILGLVAIGVVLLGGMDSALGAIVGGLIMGLVQSFASGYLHPAMWQVSPFIVMLLVLLIKPYGLFGLVRIERV